MFFLSWLSRSDYSKVIFAFQKTGQKYALCDPSPVFVMKLFWPDDLGWPWLTRSRRKLRLLGSLSDTIYIFSLSLVPYDTHFCTVPTYTNHKMSTISPLTTSFTFDEWHSVEISQNILKVAVQSYWMPLSAGKSVCSYSADHSTPPSKQTMQFRMTKRFTIYRHCPDAVHSLGGGEIFSR